jgi:uncharacterized Fe-S radical SAM superfamily protein PflX
MVEQAGSMFSHPSYESFRRAALKLGMTEDQYTVTRREFQRISEQSAELCARHVVSAGLAPDPGRRR